ncbi:hypothetical protein DSO57_1033010 [Entomophthora muscae]|uniref:Uncharacterized protein n=1 Tax=Entomophthora muscae TaxID=34485 RepID=A0ACC2RR85_9FUNG|nr:hypothetical protein DSO57_1033010 [Entomophthora muscae]
MEITNDAHHIQELLTLYYPSSANLPVHSHSSSQLTTQIRVLRLLPYTCCGVVFYNTRSSLLHFFCTHFSSVQAKLRRQSLHQFQLCDLGNKQIPIVRRTLLFLNKLNTLPSNPSHFRPSPHSNRPQDFKNPYSATMAMAYDFLDIVIHSPVEYLQFTNFLKTIISAPSHKDVWPYWAKYIHPRQCVNPPLKETNHPLYLDSAPISFICKSPSCGQLFPSIHDLRVHFYSAHTYTSNRMS